MPKFKQTKKTVVMLTPDDNIDRRILSEAKTLLENDFYVHIIAGPTSQYCQDSQYCEYEINIIRIDGNSPPPIRQTKKNHDIFGWYFQYIEKIKTKLNVNQSQGFKVEQKAKDENFLTETNWRNFYWYHEHFYQEAIKIPADIYVAHDLPMLPAALKAAFYGNAKVVYDSHELYPEQHHFAIKQIEMYKEVEARLSPLADLIVTVNQSIANEMSQRYDIPLPEIIFNSTSEPSDFKISQSYNFLRQNLKIPREKSILLFQGSLSNNRNLEKLVEAISLCKYQDFVLVIMGSGSLRNELENIAIKLDLIDKRVYFHDFVQPKDLLLYTASADFGIIPYPHIDLNSYYCTPNKLFEFILAGLPIIANDSPELNRFVSHQKIGQNAKMETSVHIADAIDNFFSSPNLLEEYRKKILTIREDFKWEKQAQKLVNLYNQLLK